MGKRLREEQAALKGGSRLIKQLTMMWGHSLESLVPKVQRGAMMAEGCPLLELVLLVASSCCPEACLGFLALIELEDRAPAAPEAPSGPLLSREENPVSSSAPRFRPTSLIAWVMMQMVASLRLRL